jgi:hypothetical protein
MTELAEKFVQDLSVEEAKTELARLASEIAHHNGLYHTHDAPEVTDAEFDALKRRNEEIEAWFPDLIRADSPSRQVGQCIWRRRYAGFLCSGAANAAHGRKRPFRSRWGAQN